MQIQEGKTWLLLGRPILHDISPDFGQLSLAKSQHKHNIWKVTKESYCFINQFIIEMPTDEKTIKDLIHQIISI